MQNAPVANQEPRTFADPFEPSCVLFSMEKAYGGWAHVSGAMRLDGEILKLEFLVRDCFFGLIKSKVRRIDLPVTEIDRITLIKGWFTTTMVLTIARVGMLERLAPKEPCRVEFVIASRDRADAEEFVKRVTFMQSERRLKAMLNN